MFQKKIADLTSFKKIFSRTIKAQKFSNSFNSTLLKVYQTNNALNGDEKKFCFFKFDKNCRNGACTQEKNLFALESLVDSKFEIPTTFGFNEKIQIFSR